MSNLDYCVSCSCLNVVVRIARIPPKGYEQIVKQIGDATYKAAPPGSSVIVKFDALLSIEETEKERILSTCRNCGCSTHVENSCTHQILVNTSLARYPPMDPNPNESPAFGIILEASDESELVSGEELELVSNQRVEFASLLLTQAEAWLAEEKARLEKQLMEEMQQKRARCLRERDILVSRMESGAVDEILREDASATQSPKPSINRRLDIKSNLVSSPSPAAETATLRKIFAQEEFDEGDIVFAEGEGDNSDSDGKPRRDSGGESDGVSDDEGLSASPGPHTPPESEKIQQAMQQDLRGTPSIAVAAVPRSPHRRPSMSHSLPISIPHPSPRGPRGQRAPTADDNDEDEEDDPRLPSDPARVAQSFHRLSCSVIGAEYRKYTPRFS
eukprot:Rmarinus@m.24543